MSIRTSNQIAHMPGKPKAITTAAPGADKSLAWGRVGADCMASLVTDTAMDITCYVWHEALKLWIFAGPAANTYKVTFEALGFYAWSVPEDALVYFKGSTTGNCYHDLKSLSNSAA